MCWGPYGERDESFGLQLLNEKAKNPRNWKALPKQEAEPLQAASTKATISKVPAARQEPLGMPVSRQGAKIENEQASKLVIEQSSLAIE